MTARTSQKHPRTFISLAIALSLASPLYAADFTITNTGIPDITPESLSANETGIIEAGGQLTTTTTAITASGINITVNNAGDISTIGASARGITSTGDYVTISNSGSITTTGGSAYGITSFGDYATITNSGTTLTAADSTDGILSFGDYVTIINSGSVVSITGDNSYGITSFGDYATISNSGSVLMAGSGAEGIVLYGDYAILSNSGSISMTGDGADGIALYGDDATMTNSGSIKTTGANSFGIKAQNDKPTINNSGLISATGTGSFAIFGGTNNDVTLNLLAGSQIIGVIDLGGVADNDTVNIYGGSASANLSFTNVENVNLMGATGFVSGNTVMTIDPTGESSRSVALSGLTSSIHGVVSQRMAHTAPFKPVQVAALSLAPGMLFQERKPVAWAQVFGGNASHDAEGSALAYGTDHIGFTLGYEWDINKTRFGLLGGVVHSKTKTDMTSFKTEADSYYVGAYGHFNFGSFKLTTSLLGGYADHDNNRLVVDNINGAEIAESDFDSFFLSPSLTLSSTYTIADRLEFRPSASLNYSVSWLDSYSEKGTTQSNFKVDDRTLKIITARVQLAAAYKLDQNSEFEFRVGLSSRHNNDDDTDVSIAGNSYSYSNASDESVSGHFAGINLRVANQDNLTLMVDMEFGGDSDEDYVNGEISLEYSF